MLRRCDACDDPAIWLHRPSPEELRPYPARLQAKGPAELLLYGVPATAACPEYAYVPERSAFGKQANK